MSNEQATAKVDLDALAQRMARLLGLPVASVQVLLPQIPEADLNGLAGLPDDQFLKASTRLIQKAQAEQFATPPPAPEGAEADKTDTTIRTKAQTQTHAAAPRAAAAEAPAAEAPAAEPTEEAAAEAAVEAPPANDNLMNRLPSVFQRNTGKKHTPEEKKKFLIMLVGAGALAVILLGASVWLMMKLFAATPEGLPVEPDAPPLAGQPPLVPPPGEGVPTATPREFKNQFAWQLESAVTMELARPDLLAASETGSFTVEFWVKPLTITHLVAVQVAANGEAGPVLALRAQRDEGGLMVSLEAPAQAAAGPRQKVTRLTEWLHLAGVYDAGAKTLNLYIGGRLANSVPANPEAPKPAAGAYTISTEVDGPEVKVLLDEVRLSTTVQYAAPFKPSRLLEAGAGVVSLLHLEQWENNVIYDAAYEQLNLPLPGGTMVDIQEDLKVLEPVEKLALPADALALLEAEGLSKDDITRFVREWNALSEAKKREWLTDAGYAGDASN